MLSNISPECSRLNQLYVSFEMDWNKTSDVELECWWAEKSETILKTNVMNCKVCKTGNVVPRSNDKEEERFMVYTSNGTMMAKHIEHICNNCHINCRTRHQI